MSEQETSKPLLFTAGYWAHEKLWAPLSEHFRLAFLNTVPAQTARQMGVDALDVESSLTPDIVQQGQARGTWMTYKVMDAITTGSLVLDPKLPPLNGDGIDGLGGWLPVFVQERAVAATMRVLACEATTEKYGKAAGVFVHEDVTPASRALAHWGIQEGLPVLHLPHGTSFLRPGTKDIHCQITAPVIGACGPYMKGWYEACGAQDVTLVGNPYWDYCYDKDVLPSREAAKRAFGLEGLTILYHTTWAQYTNVWGEGQSFLDKAFERALGVVKDMGARLLVKVHGGEPAGRDGFYKEGMEKAEIHGVVTRKYNTYSCLAADCAIVQGPSNFGIEASLLGTPVVELWQPGTRYPDYGPPGTWGEGLRELVEGAMRDGPRQEFLEAMNVGDGSVERVAEWILSKCPRR